MGYMELPIYQANFGLAAANRMSVGYNIGTVAFPCFALLQYVARRAEVVLNYRILIGIMAVVNAIALVVAGFCIDTMHALLTLTAVAGGYGWLVGLVHQRYILMYYDSTYVA